MSEFDQARSLLTQAKSWRPFARQEEFLSLPDTVFEALYGGAAGGGKSECLLLFPIARGFYKHPRFKGIIFRRTYGELEKEIILRSHEWYPACGARYNEEKKRWTFPSGAVMQFGHAEYEQDVRKYDTTEYNYMAFDELTSFTEFQYTYLTLSRCRTSTKELPAIVRAGTNPGNIGHAWVRRRFIEAGPYGSILLDPVTQTKRIFIQSLCTDNPHIDPGYINRLSGLPEAERRAKRDGDWWFFTGQVFDDWREIRLLDEPEHAVHVIEPFAIPLFWPRFLAVDWGYKAMTIALWGAVSPDLRLYVYREYSGKQLRISTWATEIGRLTDLNGEHLTDAVICKSAYQTRGDEQTLAQQFEELSGIQIRCADQDRISGLMLMRDYLRWKQKPDRKVYPNEEYSIERADHILRNFGTQALEQYKASFKPAEKELNLPRLQVFPGCKELMRCIPLVVYDENKPDDAAMFSGDDPYDCGRYLVKVAEEYMAPNSQASYEHERGKIISDMQATEDMTTFYRRMQHLERTFHSVKPFRVSRGSRRRFA